MILCDTNILIEFYRGNPQVVEALRQIGQSNLAISIVTVGELYFGARNQSELNKIRRHLAQISQIAVDENISSRFIALMGDYVLSHRLSVPDALIAATAIEHGLTLFTLNVKDFQFIPGLELYSL